jgi:FAD/FMN-containing dehydrogenase
MQHEAPAAAGALPAAPSIAGAAPSRRRLPPSSPRSRRSSASSAATCCSSGRASNVGRLGKDYALQSPAGAAPLAIARPGDVAQVAQILHCCNAHRIPVVPQGGMTGLAGGAVPLVPALLLSLERLRSIEEIDVDAGTMTVQAGVTLAEVQAAAEARGLFFPLDLGGRSAQIGGNASTNAGGNRVVRYGMMRALVLGLEAVLADGSVVSSLGKVLKNNAGYDLKHLFIGSEGTLGVITRLVLRLQPKPASTATALCAVPSYAEALALLQRLRAGLGGQLAAFELMWPAFYHLATTLAGRQPPIAEGHGLYVLVEALGSDPERDAAQFETVIGAALEAGVVADAVIAQSVAQARSLWEIREGSGAFRKHHSPQLPFDVSVATSDIGAFVDDCNARLRARWPLAKILYLGHAADGNIHISIKLDEQAGSARQMDDVVYAAVRDWKGSVSGEHGIGACKRDYLGHSRSEAEIRLMRTLKAALDPAGILNPGKVLPADDALGGR